MYVTSSLSRPQPLHRTIRITRDACGMGHLRRDSDKSTSRKRLAPHNADSTALSSRRRTLSSVALQLSPMPAPIARVHAIATAACARLALLSCHVMRTAAQDNLRQRPRLWQQRLANRTSKACRRWHKTSNGHQRTSIRLRRTNNGLRHARIRPSANRIGPRRANIRPSAISIRPSATRIRLRRANNGFRQTRIGRRHARNRLRHARGALRRTRSRLRQAPNRRRRALNRLRQTQRRPRHVKRRPRQPQR
jgi:hypothetical protein